MVESSGNALLTIEDIRERGDEYRRLDRDIALLVKRKSDIGEWLETVAKIIGKDRLHQIVGEIGDREGMPRLPLGRPKLDRVTWTSLIEDYVHKHGGPVDYPELKRAVAESPLKENFEKNDKSFYGAITKLLDAKKIVRHRGRLFSPEGLEKYSLDVMSGLVEELPDASKGRPSPAAMEVLKLLKGTPEGLRSGDIVAHLRAMPEYKRQIDRNATYAYNVFSRLVRRGNVRKEDGLYKFVSEENEAPSGDTDEASETGE